jgi:putative CocE/NonD family hydrolase
MPAQEAPRLRPAAMVRTPCDKANRYTGLKHEARYYTDRGYAFIAQDVRGKVRSEGQTLPYHFDVRDAYDTIDWIVAQAWSSGRVGLKGPPTTASRFGRRSRWASGHSCGGPPGHGRRHGDERRQQVEP